MSENNFRSQFLPFQIDTQLSFFLIVLTKWPPAAILDWTTMSVIELVWDIWMSNACVKFEERSLNSSKVIALTTKLWRGGGGGRGGGCVADENIIFPKTYVSREYNYLSGFIKLINTEQDKLVAWTPGACRCYCKMLTTVNIGQNGVGSNIAQNHLPGLKQVISDHYWPQFTHKFDQKYN